MSSFDREVPVPELGADAYVVFDLPAMDRFETEYGEDYVNRIVTGIDRGTVSILRMCLAIMLKECTKPHDEILETYPFAKVGEWMLNAIALSLHGKRVVE